MKTLFRGYYRPTETEFKDLWKQGIVALDANVLLNLYRYSSDTRARLLSILSEFKDRLWLPHQAAYEFHKNRLKVIADQVDAYSKATDIFVKYAKSLENDLGNYRRHSLINVDALLKSCSDAFESAIKTLNEQAVKHPQFSDNDEILSAVTLLFEGRVGQPFSEEKLKQIYKDGEIRYTNCRPPGYLDTKTKQGDERFGDLVLWYQILAQAKSLSKAVILVTDDAKEDWWCRSQGKTIGPRPELIEEMNTSASVGFYMYRTDQFMEMARTYLQEDVSPAILDEVREVRIHEDVARMYRQALFIQEHEKAQLISHYNDLIARKIKLEADIEKCNGRIGIINSIASISQDDEELRQDSLDKALMERGELLSHHKLVEEEIQRTSERVRATKEIEAQTQQSLGQYVFWQFNDTSLPPR